MALARDLPMRRHCYGLAGIMLELGPCRDVLALGPIRTFFKDDGIGKPQPAGTPTPLSSHVVAQLQFPWFLPTVVASPGGSTVRRVRRAGLFGRAGGERLCVTGGSRSPEPTVLPPKGLQNGLQGGGLQNVAKRSIAQLIYTQCFKKRRARDSNPQPVARHLISSAFQHAEFSGENPIFPGKQAFFQVC